MFTIEIMIIPNNQYIGMGKVMKLLNIPSTENIIKKQDYGNTQQDACIT